MNCCDYGYCQPWNSGYYQCIDKPDLCPNQETDIDYKGNDLETIYGDFVPSNSTCKAKVWDGCGNANGVTCCPDDSYCQPWNSGYYQCIDLPDQCPDQEVDVDYYGNDIQTIYGLYPTDCCDKCTSTNGQSSCYLKSGGGTPKSNAGAISGFKLIWVE
eukprot:jgi/Phyca11/12161/fgenesh1_pm.PHYCAscaffold_99_\